MTDYISREAAIAAAFAANAIGNSEYRNVYDTVERIRMIPAADVVERKHGKWKAVSEDLIICTSCKCGFLLPYPNRIEEAKTIYGWNFCPNCGADMRGDDDV